MSATKHNLLFPIGAAAAEAGVTIGTLRYLERAGRIQPLRDASGRRLFQSDQIEIARAHKASTSNRSQA